mmetsp:Transcript_90663/g.277602  ORF Transcript_90663/g.277602 Transcript_90663/m.277602 type:complete len:313 (+) Transcript_90663:2627-3565(+)
MAQHLVERPLQLRRQLRFVGEAPLETSHAEREIAHRFVPRVETERRLQLERSVCEGQGEDQHVQHADGVKVIAGEAPDLLHDVLGGGVAARGERRQHHRWGHGRHVGRGRQDGGRAWRREGEPKARGLEHGVRAPKTQEGNHRQEAYGVVKQRQANSDDVSVVHIRCQWVPLPDLPAVAELPVLHLAQVAVAPGPLDRPHVDVPVRVVAAAHAPIDRERHEQNDEHLGNEDGVIWPHGLVERKDTLAAVGLELETVVALRAPARSGTHPASVQRAMAADPGFEVRERPVRVRRGALVRGHALEHAHEAVVGH